jgi:hypothetical protein
MLPVSVLPQRRDPVVSAATEFREGEELRRGGSSGVARARDDLRMRRPLPGPAAKHLCDLYREP